MENLLLSRKASGENWMSFVSATMIPFHTFLWLHQWEVGKDHIPKLKSKTKRLQYEAMNLYVYVWKTVGGG